MNGGGAQKVIVNLTDSLAKKNNLDVELVLVKHGGEFFDLLSPRVNIHVLGESSAKFSVFKLAKYIKQSHPDVIMSSIGYANIVCIVAWFLSGRRSRLVIREAAMIDKFKGSRFVTRMTIIFQKLLYKYADALIANSEATLESFHRVGVVPPQHCYIIDNPVFLMEGGDNAADQELPTNYILAVGRLSYEKGFDVLIKSYAMLQTADFPDLVICGEGQERENLEFLIKQYSLENNVHLIGFKKDIRYYINKAEIFVLSSRQEGFGNVIVEALSCGVPVVSTNIPDGPAYILENGAFGHLVLPDDCEDLARGISDALHTPISTPELRIKKSYEFLPDIVSEKYLSVLLGNMEEPFN